MLAEERWQQGKHRQETHTEVNLKSSSIVHCALNELHVRQRESPGTSVKHTEQGVTVEDGEVELDSGNRGYIGCESTKRICGHTHEHLARGESTMPPEKALGVACQLQLHMSVQMLGRIERASHGWVRQPLIIKVAPSPVLAC